MASIYDKASLVLIPSGTKTSKVYSQKPTNGDGDFTFSRSTAATRVNASGNIEKETGNLLTYSNVFSNWSPKRGTLVQGVTNPFGGNDAWSLTATDADPYLYNQTAWSGVVTLSIWAKGVGSSIGKPIQLRMGGSFKEYTLTSEWQRFEHFVNGSASNIGIEVPNPAVAGDVVHIYGAQLEQGLVARDYIETTTTAIYGGITDNVPRLDYTDSSCPALLLEPQRTNKIASSEYFQSGWTFVGVTKTDNYGTSPEGLQNSTRIVFSGANNYMNLPSGYTGGFEACTIYMKGTAGETIKFGKGLNVAQSDLHTLTGNWQRLTFIGEDRGTAYHISTYGGATARDIEIWGAQLEDGSYATSYIPTYGSAVTRNSDYAQKNSIANLFGSDEGAFLFEATLKGGGIPLFLESSDSSGYNHATYLQMGNTSVTLSIYRLGVPQWSVSADGYSDNQLLKIGVAYKQNDIAFYVNGTQIGTNNSANTSANLSGVTIGRYAAAGEVFQYKGDIPKFLLFPTRLSNEELATLTTI